MAWVFLFCFYACSSAFAQLVETGGSFDAAQRLDLILQTIDASRLPALVGKDQWQHIVKRHQQPVLWSANQSEFHSRVNRMFDDAGISHFDYFGPSDFSLWHLRGAFPKVRIADGRVTHVGLFPEEHGGRWFVRGILEGSPASKAGILVGDEILTANGKPYEPFVHIADREGEPVRFVLARKEGEIYTTTMTPIRESLYHALQVAIMRSIRTEEFRGRKFAYVHVWTLLGKGKEFK
ncbi:MAG: PDZ domain-containing protein, partial [Phycisphaerae bacterium]